MTLVPIDHVWMRIECDDHVARELHDYFAFDVQSAKFMPQFRKRHWSGKIHLFKLRGHLIYRGLLARVLEFAAQRQYPVTNLIPPAVVDTSSLIPRLERAARKLPHELRSYQHDAIVAMLTQQRGIVLSPTGSGKSLIIYLLTCLLQQRTLIVVPTTSLVSQMASDFVSYGFNADFIQTIQAGREKDINAPVVVSTWQSIYEMPPEYFEQFGTIIVDEVHLAKAKSLTGLLEKCVSIANRFGFTGTLDDTQAHRLILEGLFGDVVRVTTTKQLMEQQHLTPLQVKMCVLKYPKDECRNLRRAIYQDEVEFLVQHPVRLQIVAQLAASTRGNVLVLFNYVEKHGKPLHAAICNLASHRNVHFISGDIAADERERIRQLVTEGRDHIIVASYGTMSTGVNIPNLDALVFASPSKSKIRVLQSIGRGLRLAEGKTHAKLIDFVDDLRVGASVNHTFRHAEQRVQYYTSEHFPFSMHEMSLEDWYRCLKMPTDT